MDENAVRLIQETAIAANDNRQARMPEGTIALPSNFQIHDLEQFQDNRRRFRGSLQTASLSDFAQYVRANHGNGFIDADNLSAKVFFNLGDEDIPGHADWTATLKLKATAPFKALQAINGKPLSQRGLIDWLEDWHNNVSRFAGDEGAPLVRSAAIEALRRLNIKSRKESTHTDADMRASRSAMEEVEASAGPSLPHIITFGCEPYLGLSHREFNCRVSVLTSHDDPMLVLRVVALEEHQESIAEEFKAVLIREIGDDATLTIGTFTP